MKNWTDTCINWNQLTATEVKRLLATWGKDAKFIAAYDKKYGFATAPAKAATPTKAEPKANEVTKAVTKKVVTKPVRQKHTGADGEIKFVEHRNLFVGFMGGKVVVTKRTKEACAEFLKTAYGVD
jgi:hypothetical protein